MGIFVGGVLINSLKGLAKGCYFPVSVYAMSLDGEVVEASGLGKYIGEPDQMCKPILDSLRPSAYAPTTHAQLFLSMQEDDGSDCMLEPRNILKKILNQLHEQHFFPVMDRGVRILFISWSTRSEPKAKPMLWFGRIR